MPQSHTAWDTPEEVLTVYYASRNVHRETIVDIMLLKFSHQRDAKQIANKLQVIRSKEREEGRPDFVSPKGAWQLFPVDAWMLQKISDEAELRELIKWTPEVEVAIKKRQSLEEFEVKLPVMELMLGILYLSPAEASNSGSASGPQEEEKREG
ncbi:hypothetical protein MMC28_001939 [Mycoblastus sanguinarius]|nr:hypothetical protein [Mycoblastus sanguinarius]